jgi:hypothetical protein
MVWTMFTVLYEAETSAFLLPIRSDDKRNGGPHDRRYPAHSLHDKTVIFT